MPLIPSYNTEQAANQITRDNITWTGTIGAPIYNLSYGFRANTPQYSVPDYDIPGTFTRFSFDEIKATEAALELWSDLANISFLRIGAGSSGDAAYTNNATMLFGNFANNAGMNFAQFPGPNTPNGATSAGDVWINSAYTNYTPGSGPFRVLLHEIGHALGLNHPGNYNGGSPTYGADATYKEDSLQYTVMSYFGERNTGADFFYASPSSPMLHDIAAIQRLYGANMSTRTGDTTYGFNSNADRSVFHVTSPYEKFAFSIWDAGGYDTLDFSGAYSNQYISLIAEDFSSVLGSTYNVSIAKGVTIEAAIGGAGADVMIGNAVDNNLRGNGGNDNINGLGGNDRLYGDGGRDILIGESGNDEIHGGDGDDTLFGGIGDDALYGDDGADSFRDDGGNDSFFGGDGDDTFSLMTGNDLIDGGAGIDQLSWSQAGTFSNEAIANLLTVDLSENVAVVRVGSTSHVHTILNIENVDGLFYYANSITGDGADNRLSGGLDMDFLSGGAGADSLMGYDGSDELRGGLGNDTIDGGSGLDFVYGDDGDDYLSGGFGVGTDEVYGGSGNDRIVYDANDLIIDGGDGNDILILLQNTSINLSSNTDQSADFVLLSNFEGLDYSNIWDAVSAYGSEGFNTIIGGFGNDAILGLGGDDVLSGGLGNDDLDGGSGNDTLNGGGGADRMIGGTGSDTFFVDDAGDQIFEAAEVGSTDRVITSISLVLAAGVEIERLETSNQSGTAALDLTGNGFAQTIFGNAGANVIDGAGGTDLMYGFGGDDTFRVDAPNDRVFEAIGNGSDRVLTTVSFTLEAGQEIERLEAANAAATTAVSLTGNTFAQTIIGNAGNNIINGGAGGDLMFGLGGDDIYYADNLLDRALEAAGGGYDRVLASISFTLESGSEVERLDTTNQTGTGAINLTGSSYNQTLIGNAGINILNGAAGADIMQGLGGNDIYYVDNAGDRVVEATGGGNDRVLTAASWVLEDNSEVERIDTTNQAGTGAINLTGNNLAQTIIGNAGNNIINGAGGADIMQGFSGDDTYYVDMAGDRVIESVGNGTDTVRTSTTFSLEAGSEIERLETTNNVGTTAINLVGNAFAQTLVGNAGNNILTGLAGNDTLIGLGGSDIFVFRAGYGRDTITDFTGGSGIADRIDLVGTGFQSFSDVLNASTQVGANLEIALNSTDVLVISNFYKGNFAFDDLII